MNEQIMNIIENDYNILEYYNNSSLSECGSDIISENLNKNLDDLSKSSKSLGKNIKENILLKNKNSNLSSKNNSISIFSINYLFKTSENEININDNNIDNLNKLEKNIFENGYNCNSINNQSTDIPFDRIISKKQSNGCINSRIKDLFWFIYFDSD